ncbi:type 1 glutamine amidotransferase domain-containing protein [Ktedonospora formicarum]|uniref:Glutamine amidotransferase n=1 Tax=Ktedonospora formicarum TaxID=2778364 RepID=A0A8J3HU08_9CHLR|nr:type 1 glutamine amidotransferase domain-containing protein [Ktedonospora formicarum]GHO43709.1 glutamine amidotransferase [Ktedonospora formicarum]
MQSNGINGMRVAIIVFDDFEQVEFTEPKKVLEQAGARVTVIAPKGGQVQGMNHDIKADPFPVDMTLDQASPDDFEGLMLPGGAINADKLRMEPRAREFVQKFDQSNRPIAAICHAPWVLISSGITKGRTLTSYYTIQDDLRNSGSNWEDKEMVRDRNLVTSRSPQDLPAFNNAMVSLFSEYKQNKAATMTA